MHRCPSLWLLTRTGKPASLGVLASAEYLILALKLLWHPSVPSKVMTGPCKARYALGPSKSVLGSQMGVVLGQTALAFQRVIAVKGSNIHSSTEQVLGTPTGNAPGKGQQHWGRNQAHGLCLQLEGSEWVKWDRGCLRCGGRRDQHGGKTWCRRFPAR